MEGKICCITKLVEIGGDIPLSNVFVFVFGYSTFLMKILLFLKVGVIIGRSRFF